MNKRNPDASNVSVSSSYGVLIRGYSMSYGSSGVYVGSKQSTSKLQIGLPARGIIVHGYVTHGNTKLVAYKDRASNDVQGMLKCGLRTVNASTMLQLGDTVGHKKAVRGVCVARMGTRGIHRMLTTSLG